MRPRPGPPDAADGRAAGVRAAVRQVRREAGHAGWQTLLVGSGLWLELMVGAERLVVDLAAALEGWRPRPDRAGAERWSSRLIGGARGRLVRVLRRWEPGVRAWRRGAARVDRRLWQRRGWTGRRPEQETGES